MNKKTILIFAALILLVGLPLTVKAATAAKAAAVTWQIFTNTTYNYQFNYPPADYYGASYTVSLDSSDLNKVFLNKVGGLEALPVYSVKVVSNVKTAAQLKTLLKTELSPLPKTTVKTSTITINGISATKMVDSRKITVAGFIKSNTAYIFHSYISGASSEPLYKKLLASFKFIKPVKKAAVFDVKISPFTCSLNTVTDQYGNKIDYIRAIAKGTVQGPVGARVELPILIWSTDKEDCGDWTYHSGALIAVGGTCVRKAGQPEITSWTVDTGGENQGGWLKGKSISYSAAIYNDDDIYSKKTDKTSVVCQ